ncbi:MAG: DUF6089 family protein [Chitinophagales bacterium]|jgi:hypothetical protein|nr:DUF6089 family protein [Chitinophagales bacterium]
MLKRIISSLVLSFIYLTLTSNSYAQFAEGGVSGGFSFYLGDIVAPYGEMSQYHPAAGMFVRGTVLKGLVSGRFGVSRGSISGDDKYSLNKFHIVRNLNFTSPITEAYLVGELNLFSFNPCRNKKFSPYVVGGIAMFHFDPMTSYYGEFYHLQELGTEGQGLAGYPAKYKLTQFSVPMGGGIKYAINKRLVVSGEFVMRKTFTDYLDDVSTTYPDRVELAKVNGSAAADLTYRGFKHYDDSSLKGVQRGDAGDKDWYNFVQINFSYIFFSRCQASEYRGRMYIGRIGCYNF